MHKLIVLSALTLVAGSGLAQTARSAQAVPCEDMLKDLRAAISSAKLSDTDNTKVKALKTRASSAAMPMTTSVPTIFSRRP